MHRVSVWSRDPFQILPLTCPATADFLGTDTAVEMQSGIALRRYLAIFSKTTCVFPL